MVLHILQDDFILNIYNSDSNGFHLFIERWNPYFTEIFTNNCRFKTSIKELWKNE